MKNCISVASALLQNQAPTLSLNKLAEMSQQQVRFPPRRTVDKALRIRDLSSLEPPNTFCCYWCNALSKKDDSETIHESLTSYRPELSDVNSYRLHCYFNEKEFNQHLLFVHLRKELDGENPLDLMDTCLQCLPCKLCIQSFLSSDGFNTKLEHAFCCCISCWMDHAINSPVHSSSPLISLLISLKNEFKSNQRVLKIIENLFFCECFVCSHLSDNYDDLLAHSRKCFASVMSQCLTYGIPYDSDIFFLSNYLRLKEEEDKKTHSLQQMNKFIRQVRLLHPSNFNLNDGEIRSLSSLERTYSVSSTSRKETGREKGHFPPTHPLHPLPSPLQRPSSPPLPRSPLKRRKGKGPKEPKRSKPHYSDDEQFLDSFDPNLRFPQYNDENCYSTDDDQSNDHNEDDIQVIKIVNSTEQSDLLPRIKPENFDPGYDKNL